MFTKQFIQVSTVIALMAISITGFAQTKVVVIPLFGDDIPAPVPEPKIVFVSAEQPNFDFGGVTVADLICEREAEASDAHSSLAGKEFKAWLYDTDTDTFHGDAPNEGMRSFNIPEGELLSPTGQSFDAASTHFLTTGSTNPVIKCDSSGSFSDCVAEHNLVWPLETQDGMTVPVLFGGLILQVTLPEPVRNPNADATHNCLDYESEDALFPGHTASILDINIIDLGRGDFFHATFPRISRCDSPVSMFCVEQ